MKPFLLLLLTCFCLPGIISAQITDPKATEVWEPEPRIVTPGTNNSAPSDAIVLFDGSNLDAWTAVDGAPPKWKISGDHMIVQKGGGIKTKEQFGDCQLHIEWSAPTVIEGTGQGRGNSGVFFQERYEVQVLDSYNNRTYSNGQAGSVYKQHLPLVNAMRAPGEWNVYDIIFMAPRFNADGMRTAPGRVTVIHNGVVVQNNVEIKGTTEYIGLPKNIAHGDDSIMLQDHSNPVRYRNIWVRKL
ncbi:MAG: DUF1080 domain-containing protein [Saprospiraceae bacterium]